MGTNARHTDPAPTARQRAASRLAYYLTNRPLQRLALYLVVAVSLILGPGAVGALVGAVALLLLVATEGF